MVDELPLRRNFQISGLLNKPIWNTALLRSKHLLLLHFCETLISLYQSENG